MGAGGLNLELDLTWPVPASSGNGGRRLSCLSFWRRRRPGDGEVVDALTATEVQPSKRKSQILDQRLEAGSTTVSSLLPFLLLRFLRS